MMGSNSIDITKEEKTTNDCQMYVEETDKDTDSDGTDVFHAAGKVLTNQLITRIIFQHLPMKDLHNVSQVSQLWKEISLNVRKDKDRFGSEARMWQESLTEVEYYQDFPSHKTPQHDKVASAPNISII